MEDLNLKLFPFESYKFSILNKFRVVKNNWKFFSSNLNNNSELKIDSKSYVETNTISINI